ncbi:MAG TPA: tetraacyldisaccharide 4'-kinase [Flavobacteriales bacterium]|nr:tetraacyldisaccharide 4'-kinase [Flavobacteriales bacterium]HIK62627.1 tetraacyldisaccharide 4'-kinase [Flavobacteriales bacterium]
MRYLLFPFSLIYASITSIRNLGFDYGIFKSQNHNIPIICIGNLSVGGSGKTPHAQYVVNLLKNNYKVAILSRGYGRNSSSLQYVEVNSTPSQVGDEPLLIKQNHPDCLVVVEKNRNKGVKQILKDFPETEIILLDDGFQHRWIKAGFNILITSYFSPYYQDYVIPVGNLRESKKGAERAQIIIISKTPEQSKPAEKKGMLAKLNLFDNQTAYFSHIEYSKWKCINTNNELQDDKTYSITLVTGIANAQPLVSHLQKVGHSVHHLEYADHHKYTTKDIDNILAKYNADKSTKKLILTTEKDAAKLREFKKQFGTENVYFSPIEVVLGQSEKFEKQILDYVAKN